VKGKRRGASFNDGDFYKWMEAASATLAVTNDPALDRQLDDIIAIIAKAQRPDGYLDTSTLIRMHNGETNAQPFKDPVNFEMYNMGHLLTAACIHYRATGKTNFLAIACKTADFLCDAFRHPTPELAHNAVCPSHYMGAVELYRLTREPRYLELAKTFLAQRNLVKDGDSDDQARIPFDEQTEAEGHAARANYLCAGAADLYLETGDQKLWHPLTSIWTNVVAEKMYITGGCGALYDGAAPDGSWTQKSITRVHQAYGRNYQLPNITAHNETCANIANALWNWRMFLATGEARYMDVVELELYNSVLSGVSLDQTNFFYTNPLRHYKVMPAFLRWNRERVPFVSSFCCPPNLARTIAESADYAYATSGQPPPDLQPSASYARESADNSPSPGGEGRGEGGRKPFPQGLESHDTIWINLYGGSTLTTKLSAGQTVRLTQETDYPWNGRIRITINECGPAPFSLKLRIPGWAAGATVRLNDLPANASPAAGTYHTIRRVWQPGDVVDLDLPMAPRLMEANPLVEETFNQVAVQRGPVVYCLESPDVKPGVSLADVTVPADIKLTSHYDRRLLGGITVIDGEGLLQPAENWTGQLYRERAPATASPLRLRFIPYYAWDNRGPSEMSVWLPLTPQ